MFLKCPLFSLSQQWAVSVSPWQLLLELQSWDGLQYRISVRNYSITSVSMIQSSWNFTQSTAVSLPCSVQNFKRIGRMSQMLSWLWINEILRDLSFKISLRWIFCIAHHPWCPIFLESSHCNFIWRSGTRRWNLRVTDLQLSCGDRD